MEFEVYLTQKKIDGAAFKASEPERYTEWQTLFQKINPESFTVQKKFLMNTIRRRYLLTT